MTNNKRAELARAALIVNTGNAQEVKADPQSAVVDMLANLRHFCDRKGLDYENCNRIGYQHYTEERAANNVARLSRPGRKSKRERLATMEEADAEAHTEEGEG